MTKVKADRHMSSLSGEFFVAAEMLKRGIQTSVTFGNAKSIDLLGYNPETGSNFTVQVKTLRKRNYFLIDPKVINKQHIYVFVLLNSVDDPVEYFLATGKQLIKEKERFDQHPKLPGIHPKKMDIFKNNWHVLINRIINMSLQQTP